MLKGDYPWHRARAPLSARVGVACAGRVAQVQRTMVILPVTGVSVGTHVMAEVIPLCRCVCTAGWPREHEAAPAAMDSLDRYTNGFGPRYPQGCRDQHSCATPCST